MSILKLHHHVTTVVRSMERETDRVIHYELADPDDWELPPFTPGAHIDVRLENGMVRQYSLCGNPAIRNRYHIAVQAEPQGRGGSLALQAQLRVGSVLPVSLPRNHFPLDPDAKHHVLIAGGIGITPFLSMLHTLNRQGANFELHYCARTPEETAFHRYLAPLAARGVVRFHHDRTVPANPLDVTGLLARPVAGEHVYCCGPGGLVAAVLEATKDRDPETVHIEQFGGKHRTAGGTAYTLELSRSGQIIPVQPDQTMLEALRGAGVEVPSSCEAGVCAVCKTRWLAGAPVHRDLIMKPAERADHLMPCVSGCSGGTLVLDL
ncbi:PDR/VanB family oxidoreductase [Niveispirillum fermenti]|uniref:PDR/VanB family oxidoreductase n=1 Tax=Niveispirillum fermenti TaxID=1233113 RepID=UPI003A862602